MIGDLPEICEPPTFSENLELISYDMMKILSSKFKNVTEMEATARVLLLVIEAVNKQEVTVQLQPTISGHTTFTDIYILVKDGNKSPLFIIEVKRFDINTTLGETKETAQVLREAHILLTEVSSMKEELPFILTNSETWSFGLATKKDKRISVSKYFKIDGRHTSQLVNCLQSLMQPDKFNWSTLLCFAN